MLAKLPVGRPAYKGGVSGEFVMMKKTRAILLLTVVLTMVLFGCSTLGEETLPLPSPEPPVTEPAITEPEISTSSPIEPTESELITQTPSPPPPPPANPLPKEGMVQLVYGGASQLEGKQIALTFDSGWEYDQTRQLLQVLEDYQVRATFFLRAGWVEDHPDMALEIAGKGHQIESHSLAHAHMGSMSRGEMEADIRAANEIYQRVLGIDPTMFRPPYGEFNDLLLTVLKEQGYRYAVMWTVDSHDWAETMNGKQVTEQYVIDRVLARASDNGIVLMHVGGLKTIDALPEIIKSLRDSGYQLVTLEEILR